MALRSQTIGPYTLDKRLGAGGMGEVYQAYDQRLDRWVAIKLIRAEAAESEKARERFRREARAAARLSHHSIIQIYDILESEEGDAIVMELVEGESLGRRLGRGPLSIDETVHLGREIAEGLAAAHARGIVHRDLKPDNVMITAEGRAKILDFGLAKRLEGEASLTEDHRVIGTYRSMSPEQAKGLDLDHRSDLFSLGILFYEMLSGRPPFDGGSTLDTLTRICTYRQTPLRQLNPAVPEELSYLVDHLLEKEPSRRPRTAREVVKSLDELGVAVAQRFPSAASATLFETPLASPVKEAEEARGGADAAPAARGKRLTLAVVLAALLLAAGLIWSLAKLRQPPLLYVAVPRPATAEGTGGAGVSVLAASLRSSLLDGLIALERVWPLAPELVDPVDGSPRNLARATAANEVLASHMSCGLATCQISLNRIRGSDGVVLWSRSFAAPVEQPYLVSEAVRGYLRQAYSDRPPQPGASKPEVRAEDYAEYMRLYESFDTHREEEYPIDVILERISRIQRSSPEFLDPFMFEAYVLQQRFRSGREPADLARAFEVLEKARALAPDDPRPLISLFEAAFLGEDLKRAEIALRELERLQPGDARVLAQRARLMDRQGDAEKALSLMREATERMPSWKHLFWTGDMEYRQGKISAARNDFHRLLRRSPDNLTGLSLLAQLELFNGDPKRAVALYQKLVRRSPQFAYLANLGLAHLLLGDLVQAEQNFRRAYEKNPRNAFITLNLADACLLLQRREEAEALYDLTLQLADKDPTARSNWQISSTRAQALAHLGRSGEAVAAIQKALQLAPSNPQVAFEASLVYVLLGDRASALFNARQALRQGIEPRWFSLPWFEPLHSLLKIEQAQAGNSSGTGG
jgi:eukaryotic-like serine/threonine-protein kinase